ncbi:hypothetical protein J3459_012079 [Metarhizium acridum]|nr:hypothetical protein J3459_012079 [Metarhizium acridum]
MAIPSSDPVPRGDVTAALNFYAPPADKAARPFNYVDDPPAGQPQRNYGDDTQDTPIHDVRGRESAFTLDRDAFQVISDVAPSSEASFADDASIRANYYPEVERLLLEAIPGSRSVHLFDHTIRRADPGAPRTPVTRVHIDQTAASVEKRVRRYFPGEAGALLAGRYRIVNVWRPLNAGPVESFPLAFASTATLDDADVVPIEHRYPDGYNRRDRRRQVQPAPGVVLPQRHDGQREAAARVLRQRVAEAGEPQSAAACRTRPLSIRGRARVPRAGRASR